MTAAVPAPLTADLPATGAAFPRWVLWGGVLLAVAYLPMLASRFDFTDDGNLVYPTHAPTLGARVAVVGQKIVANYEHLGPFRPTLWVHWEIAADLLQGSEFGWRLTRLVWCAFAASMFLWLLAELKIPPRAALAAGAVAVWNPYRNEIWTSLTLAEGVAMPYAMLALVCARRAASSPRAWAWDLLGLVSVFVALGCKNTFAALVPAQIFLRVAADGLSLRDGWRRHGWRAALLAVTLVMPITHFVYFKANWHPGQYVTESPSLAQFQRILWCLVGAMSFLFTGAGLALAAVTLATAPRPADAPKPAARHRAALGAGLLLLGAGIFVYLPMGAMSGRYSMPAVWGLDLFGAVLLAGLAGLPKTRLTAVCWLVLGAGLLGLLTASVGKQQKFVARAALLWDALEWTERELPRGARIAWISGDSTRGGLNVEEGIHFHWHLEARGRGDIRVGLRDETGQPLIRVEAKELREQTDYAMWGPAQRANMADWPVLRRFEAPYYAGRRGFECFAGRRE